MALGTEVMRKFKRPIERALEEHEEIELARDTRQKRIALDQLEHERDEANDRFKTRKQGIEANLQSLDDQVDRGVRVVQVDCQEEHDFHGNRAVIRRLDTGAVIDTRALTGDEREALATRLQLPLPPPSDDVDTDEAPSKGDDEDDAGDDEDRKPPPSAAAGGKAAKKKSRLRRVK